MFLLIFNNDGLTSNSDLLLRDAFICLGGHLSFLQLIDVDS